MPIFKIFTGPAIMVVLGLILASFTASVNAFWGVDPYVLRFFSCVAGVYLIGNIWFYIIRNRKKRN